MPLLFVMGMGLLFIYVVSEPSEAYNIVHSPVAI